MVLLFVCFWLTAFWAGHLSLVNKRVLPYLELFYHSCGSFLATFLGVIFPKFSLPVPFEYFWCTSAHMSEGSCRAHQSVFQVNSCCFGPGRYPVSLHCWPLGRHFKDHHCHLTQSMHRAPSVPTTMSRLSLHLWNVWPCTENHGLACDLRSWLYDIGLAWD